MPNILAKDPIKALEEDLPMLVQRMEAREMKGQEGSMQPFHPQGRQEIEIEEEEEPPLEPIHVSSIVEVANTFSPIEDLASNLGVHTALDYLYKAK